MRSLDIVLLCFCISFAFSIDSDGLSLLALKLAIARDPSQALISWNEKDATPCKWTGVTCDPFHGKVTSMSLSGKNLSGYIPSELGALSFLTSLDLSRNNFWGTLPHQLFNLQNLVHLDISSNSFNGSLPEGLNDLTHLGGTLNLSYNGFSGEIPASFGRLPVMVSLDISHNNLTGKIPQIGSLLNQGPTAFSGNPYLCGFPLSTPCTDPAEAQNPTFSSNPENPHKPGISSNGLARNRKFKGGGLMIVTVIFTISLVVLLVSVSTWAMNKRNRKTEERKGGNEIFPKVEVIGKEDRKNGRFVALDEEFGLEIEDLLRASAYVMGKSKSGILYKVVVGGGGKSGASAVSGLAVVAVRRLSEADDALWRLKEFEVEVEAIAKVQHPNIVKLKAYYYARDEKLLVSEFIRNGSLQDALHGTKNHLLPSLKWASRLRIAQGIARGLMHIHECNHKKFIHGNLRSSKILLDDDLKPYISGFGLPRLSQGTSAHKKKLSVSQSSLMYIAPEARDESGKLTQKCDVYSFGIVLLELLTGGMIDGGLGLEEIVRDAFREERRLAEIIDPHLLPEIDAKKQVVAMFHVALSCTDANPDSRPRMRAVLENIDCITLL